MKESQYKWQINKLDTDSAMLNEELDKLNLSRDLAPFLWTRQIRESEKINAFFNPQVTDFHDPFLLHDMEKAIGRIQQGVEQGERILVYGDYDADGITSTTVMKEAIELIGGEVIFYLPNRFTDGYGPNKEVYKRMIEEEGVQLIITVDNGVSGHEAIDYATSKGIDVIVTDHHELPDQLPEAFAIIHPRHPEAKYPFGDLAGVGVAFKVATALLGEIPVESLDLVAIGTIADLVSLTGENRSMVKIGLEMMKQTERIGLHMLAKEAKIDLLSVSEETVGFTIAPRLNAIGRLGDASPGVDLLSTFDDGEALELAQFITQKNVERQGIVKKITAEALAMAETKSEESILFLMSKDWHEGVLGIVASQVVSKTGKPTIVLRIDEETNIVKGSGRSVEAIDLFQTLSLVKEDLISFGGHHMAAGLSFSLDSLSKIEQQLTEYLNESGLTQLLKETLMIDSELPISAITVEYIEMLKTLAPFGTDNPAPYFLIKAEKIEQIKQIGADNAHLKCQVKEQNDLIDCIAFSRGAEIAEFTQEAEMSLVGQLSINEWNGFRKPQFMLTDYEVSGYQLFDIRGKKAIDVKPSTESPAYLLFNEEHLSMVSHKNQRDVYFGYQWNDMTIEAINQYEEVVVVDCPYNLDEAREVFKTLSVKRIYWRAQVSQEHYLTGLPSRGQFGQLFKLIASQPSIDIRHKLTEISKYLRIEKNLLIFMIQVFFDLGFVTIEDGLMAKVENPTNRPLQESKIYQNYEHKIDMEKLFLYSDIKEIKEWILQQEDI